MSATTLSRNPAAPYQIPKPIVDAMARMKRGVKHPTMMGAYSFLSDLARYQPRNTAPLGRYPEAASECAANGAPMSDVFAPLYMTEADLTAKHFSGSLPSRKDAQHAEEMANHKMNDAQLWLEAEPENPAAIAALLEAASEQVAATKTLLAAVNAKGVSR